MANRIIIPAINVLPFYDENPEEDPRFLTRDFIDWEFSDTVHPWQQKPCWFQPWQKSDVLKLQVQSNIGPVTLKLFTWDGGLVDTIPFNQVSQNVNDPEMFIYEVNVDMSGYRDGKYYFQRVFGSGEAVLSQKSVNINLSEKIENTIFLECSNPSYREDMVFETGIQPGIRIPGILKYKGPASKNTIYEDQPLNTTILRSLNYRVWTLSLGGSSGMPDYMADIIDRMLGCKTVIVDGKYYTKVDASLEPNEVENYPMRGWKIDLREKLNRASRHYENEVPQNVQLSVMINVDSRGFGSDTGGNETVIVDVE